MKKILLLAFLILFSLPCLVYSRDFPMIGNPIMGTSSGTGAGAPTDAHYITDQAEGDLSAEVVATTVGKALVTLTNPGAVTWIRVNADNTVTALSAANMLSGIGAQASDATLTALAGITLADVTIIEGTGADAVNPVTSGGNNYFLGSKSDNSELEFKTPAATLAAIGGAPSDIPVLTTTAVSGLSAESNLGELSTGLVQITVAAGVATPSIATSISSSGISGLPIVNARVDAHTALSPMTADQVSGTIVRNTGQALADVDNTLPQAAAGYSFIAEVGTTLAATNYWRFTADASPQDYMCLDGTCGKLYVSVDTPTQGDCVSCFTEQMSSTGIKNEADLGIGTSANTAVKNTVAVEFDIAGTGYSKAIAETAPGNDVIPSGKYGAVAFEIGADGTIDAIEASANATGYDSVALAIAGIPAVAASHTRLGTVTATKSDGDFTFGTTALNVANSTVVYTDATVYTPPYAWICVSGQGTWTTN